jgi:glycosyltransferase involved in cell wall biosynthesis
MRILHLIPKLSSGGTERQLAYVCNELILSGHEVHIAYLQDAKGEIIFNTDVRLHKLRTSNNHNPKLVLQLIKLIKDIAPDIVNTWILQMDILGGIASLYCRVPFVLREPSSALAYPANWKNKLRILIGKYSVAIIANSNDGIKYWKKFAPNHIYYKILNGLPIEKINTAPSSYNCGVQESEFPVLLYVGRLVSDLSGEKNLINLLKALAIVNNFRKVNCILCGDGPQRSELEKLRNDLNISDKVLFVNHINPHMVWGLMKKSTIFISLSSFEGCPNSVLEAIACKCPLILSDIPAHKEILDSNEAKFVNHLNINSIADGILEVLKNTFSFKEQAIKNVEKTTKWSTKLMFQSFEEVYRRHKK